MLRKPMALLLIASMVFSTAVGSFANSKDTNGLKEYNDVQKMLELRGPVDIIRSEFTTKLDQPSSELTIQPLDVPVPWTENTSMTWYTNTHFQSLTKALIATTLAAKFGGLSAAYGPIATALYGNAVVTETHNTWQIIRYYYQWTYDPDLPPYYVKQVIYNYSNLDRTDFIGIHTNYYYSHMPY